MKYVYVTSARRNPESNIKQNRNAELTKYYDLDKEAGSPQHSLYYVSLTSLPKVGVNPNNRFSTPTGIYTYPISYAYERILKNTLPYAGERKYIQVLRLQSKRVLCDVNYTRSDYKKDAEKLERLWIKHRHNITFANLQYAQNHLLEKVTEDLPDFFLYEEEDEDESSIDDLSFYDLEFVAKALAQSSAKLNSRPEHPVNLLWGLTQVLALLLFRSPTFTSKWNALLRYIGYDVVIDRGLGFIHPHEPTQALFLTPTSYKHVAMIENKTPRESEDKRPDYLRKFYNLTEEQYAQYSKINPAIRNIKCSCQLSLDCNRIRITSTKNICKNADLRDFIISIACENCKLTNCTVRHGFGGRVERSVINKCVLEHVDAVNCSVYNSTAIASQLIDCDVIVDSTISHCEVVDATLKNCVIRDGGNVFKRVKLINCQFGKNKDKCQFIDCDFEG